MGKKREGFVEKKNCFAIFQLSFYMGKKREDFVLSYCTLFKVSAIALVKSA